MVKYQVSRRSCQRLIIIQSIASPIACPCLVRRQPFDDSSHLLVGVYPETLVLCHARQLHILGIQLLLHNLLQRLENQSLGVDYSQGLDKDSQSTVL
jgi:hypothetical protein